ncbi:Pyoverdine sidechain peptide synthetase II, D-Asp-L-Thr component, partial [Pseudomonas syringae pv. philadelphi]
MRSPVGANLLAKAIVQFPHFAKPYRPLREQARSHKNPPRCQSVRRCRGPVLTYWMTCSTRSPLRS